MNRSESIIQKSREGLNKRLAFSVRQRNGEAHGTYTLTCEVLETADSFQLALRGEIPSMLPTYPKTAAAVVQAVAELEKRTVYSVADDDRAAVMALYQGAK
jgi:hypothetical protein